MKETRYVLGFGVCCFAAGLALIAPLKPTPKPPPMPLDIPVPLQDVTPTAPDAGTIGRMVTGTLPPPGPNQVKDAKQCKWPAKFIDGGCWMAVSDLKPPCESPDGTAHLWPHAGKCWTPFAEAKPVPQSGEPRRSGVAGP